MLLSKHGFSVPPSFYGLFWWASHACDGYRNNNVPLFHTNHVCRLGIRFVQVCSVRNNSRVPSLDDKQVPRIVILSVHVCHVKMNNLTTLFNFNEARAGGRILCRRNINYKTTNVVCGCMFMLRILIIYTLPAPHSALPCSPSSLCLVSSSSDIQRTSPHNVLISSHHVVMSPPLILCFSLSVCSHLVLLFLGCSRWPGCFWWCFYHILSLGLNSSTFALSLLSSQSIQAIPCTLAHIILSLSRNEWGIWQINGSVPWDKTEMESASTECANCGHGNGPGNE